MFPTCVLNLQHNLRASVYKSRIYKAFVESRRVKKIRNKPVISVLFIAYNAAMWKWDSLYCAMKKHPRFKVEILLVPNMAMPDVCTRNKEWEILRDYFSKKQYHYVEFTDVYGDSQYGRIPQEHDILFYPQPWPGIVPRIIDFPYNKGRLVVCCEYAFHSGNQNWAFNKWLQNAAWIDCYENDIVASISKKEKDNNGVNSVVTGLPIMDEFQRTEYRSPWKSNVGHRKKIIWAPHWTITEQSSVLPSYSNFLEMADYMLQYASEHSSEFQFAFKPHPLLKKELYKHPSWGKEKTDEYFSEWENGENTQLEQGEYVDLFMTSDAMIHDSSSFCCEYMLTGKPVLFMVKNEGKQVSQLNEMSRSAFYAQYLGVCMDDISNFLVNCVKEGADSKKEIRNQIVSKYFVIPHGRTAAENIIERILG